MKQGREKKATGGLQLFRSISLSLIQYHAHVTMFFMDFAADCSGPGIELEGPNIVGTTLICCNPWQKEWAGLGMAHST